MAEVKIVQRVNCQGCGKIGYTDEFSPDGNGNYLCVRCANPHLNWDAFDNGGSL